MINVKHKNCITCKLKQACYNYINKKTTVFFRAPCKLENMVNIRDKNVSHVT